MRLGARQSNKWNGKIVSIHVAPTAIMPMMFVKEGRAVAGKGQEADRYFNQTGHYFDRPGADREVTLVEIEAIEALSSDYEIGLEPGNTCRNIVTRSVPLNHLVGREFTVGKMTVRAIRLYEPCSLLEGLTEKGVLEGLIQRGGLRAQILTDGMIRVGDPIQER